MIGASEKSSCTGFSSVAFRLHALTVFPACCLVTGCGGGGNSAVGSAPQTKNPTPTIIGMSPSFATAGAVAQTVMINGTTFLSDSVVTFNGSAHTATFVSANQLTISFTFTGTCPPRR